MSFKQGTVIAVKQDFTVVNPATGRRVSFKSGKIYWIGSAEHAQTRTGVCEVVKKGYPMGHGLPFNVADVEQYFEIVP